MFLESAVAAETRLKILRALFQEALPQLDASALSAETGKSVAGVHKALAELLPTRVILPVPRGRKTYYAVNASGPWFTELLALFRRERERANAPHLFPTYWNHLEPVVGRLAARSDVLAVLLYGSLVRPPVYPSADVDLLVLLEDKATRPRLEGRVLGHSLSLLALHRSSFERKARAEDDFVASALERHVLLYQDPAYSFPWEPKQASFSRRQRRWVR